MKLLVLTQNNCRFCGRTKGYLKDHDIEFDEINTSLHPEYITKYDVMGAPTVLLLDGEEVIMKVTGHSEEDLDVMIEQL